MTKKATLLNIWLAIQQFSACFPIHFARQLKRKQNKPAPQQHLGTYRIHILPSTDVSPLTCQHIPCHVTVFSFSILKLNQDIFTISSCQARVHKTSDHAVTYKFRVNNRLTHNSWLSANTMLIDS